MITALLLAAPGSANLPNGGSGVNCSADGKISGRGATFAWFAQWNWMRGFRNDVCGQVSDTALPGSTSTGDTMVLYNGTNGDDTQVSGNQGAFIGGLAAGNYTPGSLTGSGNGRNSQICRSDAFGGSDGPYSISQLASMDAAPPAAPCSPFDTNPGTASDYFSPFNPTGSPYPNASDKQAPIMSFPIAVSDVGIVVNFNSTASGTNSASSAQCRAGVPNLTATQVSKIMGGDFINWSEVIPGCTKSDLTPLPIKRVVRRDNSGTSQIILNYLHSIDANRTLGGAATCEGTLKWTGGQLSPLNENQWPGDQSESPCSPIVHGWKNGNPGVLDVIDGAHKPTPGTAGAFPQQYDSTLATTFDDNGAIGYADLADTENQIAVTPQLKLANVRNATNSAFVNAATAAGANCDTGSITQPGSGTDNIVGLNGDAVGGDDATANTTDNWAVDQASNNRADITNKGTLYPICGMTWALVYEGMSNDPTGGALGTGAPNPNSRLSANQRRTLYSYFSYILSSAGQAVLDNNWYASLPPKLASDIRTGFQTHF